MRVSVIETAEHHRLWCGAFAQGLRRHGHEVIEGQCPVPADLTVFWGVRQAALAQSPEVCILERGYVGDRQAWTSVSFGGGLNGCGEFRAKPDSGARWRKHFGALMRPWRARPEGYALILGQVPTDHSVRGVDVMAWYRKVAGELCEAGWPVRFRPHPVMRDMALPGAETLRGTLAEALDGAAFAVTWNSNSAVDAVLAGVPTVTADEGAMAWPVTSHVIGLMPPLPSRKAWAHRLAWCQFTIEEMRSGTCWEWQSGSRSQGPSTGRQNAMAAA